MGRAKFEITPELLRDLIPLPYTAYVLGSVDCCGNIAIVVEDSSLPDTKEGECPLVRPMFRSNRPVEFVGWGV